MSAVALDRAECWQPYKMKSPVYGVADKNSKIGVGKKWPISLDLFNVTGDISKPVIGLSARNFGQNNSHGFVKADVCDCNLCKVNCDCECKVNCDCQGRNPYDSPYSKNQLQNSIKPSD
jgi:hypothetical protein